MPQPYGPQSASILVAHAAKLATPFGEAWAGINGGRGTNWGGGASAREHRSLRASGSTVNGSSPGGRQQPSGEALEPETGPAGNPVLLAPPPPTPVVLSLWGRTKRWLANE